MNEADVVVPALPLGKYRTAERSALDWTLCDGHALCAGVSPELIHMGREGYPVPADTAVPPHLTARTQVAVRRCPAPALRIEGI
ncbi:ferredoxin [Streptomyces sp. NPDC003710]